MMRLPVMNSPALMKVELVGDGAQLAGTDQAHVTYSHRMEFAVDRTAPEIQEAPQHRKFRRMIKRLPSEGLQHPGVIGHVIGDFRGGQPIPEKLLLKV